ncbi:MAG TPA: hypothetical protein VGH28_17465, partial [Polyangiaceae bacterium]
MKLRSICAIAPCFGLVVVVACGGDGSGFPDGTKGTNGDGGPNADAASPFNNSGGGDGGDLSQCATATATPNPVPVDLVFMFD